VSTSGRAGGALKNLSPKQKRGLMLGGIAVAVLVAFMGLRSTTLRSNDRAPVSADNLLTSADSRALGLASLNSELARLRAQSNTTQETTEELTKSRAALQARVEELEKAAAIGARNAGSTAAPLPPGDVVRPLGVVPGVSVDGRGNASPASVPPIGQTETRYAERQKTMEAFRGRNGGENAPSPDLPEERRPAPAILTIGEPAAATEAASKTPAPASSARVATPEPAVPEVFLPAGTLITTVLLNGMDAPTGRSAQNQPLPILARVKTDANLPNRFFADIRECRLIGSAWGDLSSERAYIRSETLSCVRDDGGAIEVKLKSFATGEDGKFGLRGTVVEKRGKLIGRAALAGFLQGVSEAFQPQRIPVLATTGGDGNAQFQGVSGGDAAQVAGFGGVSGAADRLADYYIKRADELVPVIEISAGREVTFVVQEGKSLVLRSDVP